MEPLQEQVEETDGTEIRVWRRHLTSIDQHYYDTYIV